MQNIKKNAFNVFCIPYHLYLVGEYWKKISSALDISDKIFYEHGIIETGSEVMENGNNGKVLLKSKLSLFNEACT